MTARIATRVSGLQRRNRVAARNMLRTYPAFWRPGFWNSLRIAREAQARGAMQKLRELAPLVALLHRTRPCVVVEIGTARGGTFFAWCSAAPSDATVVSIDLPGGRYGGGYPVEAIARLQSYARAQQELHFLRANSQEESTVSRLRDLLGGRDIEFLFIDGDHSYEGVRRDYELYAPLVGKGCPIAFHDVLPHPEEQGCEVDRFWNEVKREHPHVEFIDSYAGDPGSQYGGIGVVFR